MTAQMQRPASWANGGNSHDVFGPPFDPEIDDAISQAMAIIHANIARAQAPAGTVIRIGHEPTLPKRRRLRAFLRNFRGIWLVIQFVVYGSAVVVYVWSVKS
jgi:hypothetical protein